MSANSVTGHSPGGEGEPRYYRHHGVARRLLPTTWGSFHAWFFVIFSVATFGPMFHWWADSNTLVGGWPISMGWILVWMIAQSLNLIAFFFTTVRPTFDRIAVETGVAAETTADDTTSGHATPKSDSTPRTTGDRS